MRTIKISPERAAKLINEGGYDKRLYSGKYEGCRCGCLGTYYCLTECNYQPPTKPTLFNSMKNRILKTLPEAHLIEHTTFDNGKGLVNIEKVAGGRVYSLYNYI